MDHLSNLGPANTSPWPSRAIPLLHRVRLSSVVYAACCGCGCEGVKPHFDPRALFYEPAGSPCQRWFVLKTFRIRFHLQKTDLSLCFIQPALPPPLPPNQSNRFLNVTLYTFPSFPDD